MHMSARGKRTQPHFYSWLARHFDGNDNSSWSTRMRRDLAIRNCPEAYRGNMPITGLVGDDIDAGRTKSFKYTDARSD